MGFLKISPSGTSTLVQFAGDVMNKLADLFSGINIASTDSSNKPDIATQVRFRSDALRVFDNDRSHSFGFRTAAANITEDKAMRIPSLIATEDELLFASQPAVVVGKTLDWNANTILNFPPPAGEILGLSKGGIAEFTGNGSQTVFNIAHTMGGVPDIFLALPNTVAALGEHYVQVDATNIIITYTTPPPGGFGSVKFAWVTGNLAEPTEEGITATSADILTNKKIGITGLGFLAVGSPPANPPAGEVVIYPKAIDANNDGLFIKGEKNGVIVEQQIW